VLADVFLDEEGEAKRREIRAIRRPDGASDYYISHGRECPGWS
jgi:hypothetical protein